MMTPFELPRVPSVSAKRKPDGTCKTVSKGKYIIRVLFHQRSWLEVLPDSEFGVGNFRGKKSNMGLHVIDV
jgi:hypothetical protein